MLERLRASPAPEIVILRNVRVVDPIDRTVRNGQSIDISFVLDKKTLQQDPQLVESVLASFRWVA